MVTLGRSSVAVTGIQFHPALADPRDQPGCNWPGLQGRAERSFFQMRETVSPNTRDHHGYVRARAIKPPMPLERAGLQHRPVSSTRAVYIVKPGRCQAFSHLPHWPQSTSLLRDLSLVHKLAYALACIRRRRCSGGDVTSRACCSHQLSLLEIEIVSLEAKGFVSR